MKIIFTDSGRSVEDSELLAVHTEVMVPITALGANYTLLVPGFWVQPGKIKWAQATSSFQYQLCGFPANGP